MNVGSNPQGELWDYPRWGKKKEKGSKEENNTEIPWGPNKIGRKCETRDFPNLATPKK